MITKIHVLCDTFGRPLRFMLTAGQRHHNLTAKALLQGFRAEAMLADRAYDNNDLLQTSAVMNAEAVIPSTRGPARLRSRTNLPVTAVSMDWS